MALFTRRHKQILTFRMLSMFCGNFVWKGEQPLIKWGKQKALEVLAQIRQP